MWSFHRPRCERMRGGCVEFGDWGYWLVQGWFRSLVPCRVWWLVDGLGFGTVSPNCCGPQPLWSSTVVVPNRCCRACTPCPFSYLPLQVRAFWFSAGCSLGVSCRVEFGNRCDLNDCGPQRLWSSTVVVLNRCGPQPLWSSTAVVVHVRLVSSAICHCMCGRYGLVLWCLTVVNPVQERAVVRKLSGGSYKFSPVKVARTRNRNAL